MEGLAQRVRFKSTFVWNWGSEHNLTVVSHTLQTLSTQRKQEVDMIYDAWPRVKQVSDLPLELYPSLQLEGSFVGENPLTRSLFLAIERSELVQSKICCRQIAMHLESMSDREIDLLKPINPIL